MAARTRDGGQDWAREHQDQVRAEIDRNGAVLVRGLGVRSADEVGAVAAALGIALMPERERFASRKNYSDVVYSSTEWPTNEPICMHNELSYAAEVPSRAIFGCLTAPASGGQTRVADSAALLAALPTAVAGRFERDGWRLTRMYHDMMGVSLAESFGTRDRAEIDAYCAARDVESAWLPDGRLVTRQRGPAVVRHPRTGERTWCNQAVFLNERTLDQAVREYLVDVYGPDGLPFNTAYGDGTPLTRETVDAVNDAYRGVSGYEPWRDGDVLLVDNIRMAHGRDPFEGDREIVVAFGDPVRLSEYDDSEHSEVRDA